MNKAFFIRHPAFKPYKASFPIDWMMDPYKNRTWLHHFNSLRWMRSIRDKTQVEEILKSFYESHCVRKIKNLYYINRRGARTGAIRLRIFFLLKKKYEEDVDAKGVVDICNLLIKAEIKNLQRPEMYRDGSSHGLMLDIALLNVVLDYPEFASNIDLPLIKKRSVETIDCMWHESGLTREHSISYQEFKLPITVEYFSVFDALGEKPSCKADLSTILEESKKLLGFALKANGEYFPLGDSFREPKPDLLRNIYTPEDVDKKSLSVHEILAPFSTEEGCYANEHFFFFRKTLNGKKIHFTATCCWDSRIHKQDDELSFCLEIDGVSVFDDVGYTEFVPWEELLELQSADSHSTIQIAGMEWSDRMVSNGRSRIKIHQERNNGFFIEMECERIEGVVFNRSIELNGDLLTIQDKITGDLPPSVDICRRFICANGIQVNELKDGYLTLTHENKNLVALQFLSSQFYRDTITYEQQTPLVLTERRYNTPVNVIEHKLKSVDDREVKQCVAIMEIKL